MQAARLLYAEIGRQVERHGLDSVSRRAVVPRSRKAWRLAGAIVAALLPESAEPAPALTETRFLVEAVADIATPSRQRGRLVPSEIAWWNLSERIAWVIELFEELERARGRRAVPEPLLTRILMDPSLLAGLEFVLVIGVVLGLGVWELVSLRRARRRDREAAPPDRSSP